MNLQLRALNEETGEVIPPQKLKPRQIKEYLQGLSNQEQSEFLTKVNFVRKISNTIEKTTKDYIKENNKFVFDDSNHAFFGDHRLTQVITTPGFDEKALMASGNQEDINTFMELKKKYLRKPKPQIRF